MVVVLRSARREAKADASPRHEVHFNSKRNYKLILLENLYELEKKEFNLYKDNLGKARLFSHFNS